MQYQYLYLLGTRYLVQYYYWSLSNQPPAARATILQSHHDDHRHNRSLSATALLFMPSFLWWRQKTWMTVHVVVQLLLYSTVLLSHTTHLRNNHIRTSHWPTAYSLPVQYSPLTIQLQFNLDSFTSCHEWNSWRCRKQQILSKWNDGKDDY